MKPQSFGFASHSTARVILGQVLSFVTCGSPTHTEVTDTNSCHGDEAFFFITGPKREVATFWKRLDHILDTKNPKFFHKHSLVDVCAPQVFS